MKDLEEAQYVADYIQHGGDKEAFLMKFQHAVSKGFDPDKHLQKVEGDKNLFFVFIVCGVYENEYGYGDGC
ncbi:hypothetical protein EON63_07910 [archaeon]|nr:MAG: hypothetical protein EON63_07910 [archaeon]